MTEKEMQALLEQVIRRQNEKHENNIMSEFAKAACSNRYSAGPKPPEVKEMGEVRVLSTKVHYPTGSTRRN